MKSPKTFLVPLVLLASFLIGFGQENPKAELVDEFSALSCDEFRARIDNLLSQILGSSDSQGYIYTIGKEDDLGKKVFRELLIKGHIELRNFDKNRIIFVRGTSTEDFSTQLWKVPANAEKPDLKKTEWNFVFPPQTEPFLFYGDSEVEGICPSIHFEMAYVEYLNANPQARGHIVIYAKSLKKYNKLKKETRNLLNHIPLAYFRFFHIKKAHSDNYANVEYWLVPRNAK